MNRKHEKSTSLLNPVNVCYISSHYPDVSPEILGSILGHLDSDVDTVGSLCFVKRQFGSATQFEALKHHHAFEMTSATTAYDFAMSVAKTYHPSGGFS